MLKRSCVTVAALLLTGCGTTTTPVAEEAPKKADMSKQRLMESSIATCMKQAGFKYVPNVGRDEQPSSTEAGLAAGDYATMKADRAKYGFRVFSGLAYPDDPGSGALVADFGADPNWKITQALSDKQTKAYEKATDRCHAKAARKVLGKDVKDWRDQANQAAELVDKLTARELDGDAKVIALAQTMAGCLNAKGYRIPAARPSAVAGAMAATFTAEREALLAKQYGAETASSKGVTLVPDLPAEEAQVVLRREIKAALDDLECGKEFYPVFAPRKQDIERRVSEEFGGERRYTP
ncbi:hypothetical protein [Nonomuraea sp. NPDC046570]|uniref:hypothetical protein n=1 Tax=Nonomuraea sp. NPDC046570 TaxID=3155255 RepID=UPI00340A7CE5